MRRSFAVGMALALLPLMSLAVQGQPPTSPLPAPKPGAPASTAVAVTVNGQPILESAVQRALRRVPPERHSAVRPEILDFLIETTLIDQYLVQQTITVDPKEIDARVEQMKGELQKEKLEFAQVLREMGLTEAELREHLALDLRWNKFADAQATDKALKDLFTSRKDLFDGSMVRVRHILLTPGKDPKDSENVRAGLLKLKQEIETKAVAEIAKLPADADALTREKTRLKVVEESFAAAAKEKSACPSKQQGGDVGWFDRAGTMVEPFASAAFALQPYQMSDVVQTQFGMHLLLLLERKAGKEIEFEQVKKEVKEIHGERLREALASQLRQRAKIVLGESK